AEALEEVLQALVGARGVRDLYHDQDVPWRPYPWPQAWYRPRALRGRWQRLAQDTCLDTPGPDRPEGFACLQMTVVASPLPEACPTCSLGLPSDEDVVTIRRIPP